MSLQKKQPIRAAWTWACVALFFCSTVDCSSHAAAMQPRGGDRQGMLWSRWLRRCHTLYKKQQASIGQLPALLEEEIAHEEPVVQLILAFLTGSQSSKDACPPDTSSGTASQARGRGLAAQRCAPLLAQAGEPEAGPAPAPHPVHVMIDSFLQIRPLARAEKPLLRLDQLGRSAAYGDGTSQQTDLLFRDKERCAGAAHRWCMPGRGLASQAIPKWGCLQPLLSSPPASSPQLSQSVPCEAVSRSGEGAADLLQLLHKAPLVELRVASVRDVKWVEGKYVFAIVGMQSGEKLVNRAAFVPGPLPYGAVSRLVGRQVAVLVNLQPTPLGSWLAYQTLLLVVTCQAGEEGQPPLMMPLVVHPPLQEGQEIPSSSLTL